MKAMHRRILSALSAAAFAAEALPLVLTPARGFAPLQVNTLVSAGGGLMAPSEPSRDFAGGGHEPK